MGMTKARQLPTAKVPVSARRLTATTGLLGSQALCSAVVPDLAVAVTVVEVSLIGLIVLTALFGPEKLSERAFRILSWVRC
jgi:hypothetical protein